MKLACDAVVLGLEPAANTKEPSGSFGGEVALSLVDEHMT